jgi:eukaryotic-like serine/threonine-protein kinase
MSTVHRAYDRCTGHEVAVKISRAAPDMIDAIGPIRQEVGLLSTLDDPGLVALLDADVGDDGTPAYMVSELVEGPNLAQWIRCATLTEQQTARLGATMCRTLAYVHARGIVHRDVKPANILVSGRTDADLAPKLVDFGIATTVDSTRLAADDATVGTANYLSPEQVRGDRITTATDMYSLGLVLIEALTGALAYPGTGARAAMARLDRSATVPEGVSRGLRTVLADLTASDPADRPAAGPAAKILDRIAAGYDGSLSDEILMLAGPASESDRPPHLRTFRPRRRRTVLAAAAAVFLGGCVAFTATLSSSDSRPSGPPQAGPRAAAAALPPAPQKPRKPAPRKVAAPLRRSPAPAPAPDQLAAGTPRGDTTDASHVAALPKQRHAHPAKHAKVRPGKVRHSTHSHAKARYGKAGRGQAGSGGHRAHEG